MTDRSSLHQDSAATASFGFWVYLMTDCVLFATLFATYAVLRTGTQFDFELFSLPNVLVETGLLLTSSFTCGLAMLAARRSDRSQTVALFGLTFLLGLLFLRLEVSEFSLLARAGHSWRESGFLSSYFTLVGAHGMHIAFGLVWMAVLLVQVWRRGLSQAMLGRLVLLSLFWHFLDIVWIFIFTIVYLMGGRAV